MKLKLDAAVVAAAECPTGKKKIDLWCTHNPGLVLEVRASGGKTYYLRYQDQHGAQRQHKIARSDQISLDQARKTARQLMSKVALGGDPMADKAEKRAVPLYGTLADDHIAHARTHIKSIKTLKGYIDNHIRPRWGKVRLTDIKQQDVAKWLAEKRAEGLAPATVEKIRVIFSRSFELAARWETPGGDKNPVRGVPRPKFSNAREKYVTADETARLMAAAAKSRNPELANVIGLLLLTGARVSELLSARWQNVDIDRRDWFIPTSKTGRSRHVPLSQAALDIIEALPKGSGFLFPNPRNPKRHLTTIKHGWQTARVAAGLPDLRIHDLRHSAASAMINNGVGMATVGKLLGHANLASTARYSHFADDTLAAAVEAGAAKLKLGIAA
ncbi:site-specific integrase [Sphingomonas sp.]|uniref:site-specific integrase n=1 Tax=Sphingomonas sp. TaxID=28214 RepID=UPI000DB38238|nr:site-specific integrase [Sphingomonas sp.]PZU08512.1 MAG: integrase [Sphingomonas sp.]